MNPAELAHAYAEELSELHFERDVNNDEYEVDRFTTLSNVAKALDLIGRPFIVKAQPAVAFPVRHESLELADVTFMGEFSGYDIVTPPRALGIVAFEGLYLTFNHVIMLSDALLSDAPIHVAPAAASIERLVA